MVRFKKCIRNNKIAISILILICISGTVILMAFVQVHAKNMKSNDSMTNVTHVPIIVETIETGQVSSLAPIQTSFPMPSVPMPKTIPEGNVYQRPVNIPSLREYEINKDSNIWRAEDPESYITPNNEWVKYVASQIYVDNDGRIRHKNMPIPRIVDYNGNVISWTDEPFFNNYVLDDELFDFPANADMWQNADYYLSHGMRGDCEDWSIAVVSMMSSGEMSIKENETYIRQVIPAKAVIGYAGNTKDVWIEYSVYGNRYISATGTSFNQDTGKYQSITALYNESDWKGRFAPIYQFTNKSFGRYNNN